MHELSPDWYQAHIHAERRLGARLSSGPRVVAGPVIAQCTIGSTACLCSVGLEMNVRSCSRGEVRLTAEGTEPTNSTACSAARAAALSSDDRHSAIARLRSGIRMPRVVLWSRCHLP